MSNDEQRLEEIRQPTSPEPAIDTTQNIHEVPTDGFEEDPGHAHPVQELFAMAKDPIQRLLIEHLADFQGEYEELRRWVRRMDEAPPTYENALAMKDRYLNLSATASNRVIKLVHALCKYRNGGRQRVTVEYRTVAASTGRNKRGPARQRVARASPEVRSNNEGSPR